MGHFLLGISALLSPNWHFLSPFGYFCRLIHMSFDIFSQIIWNHGQRKWKSRVYSRDLAVIGFLRVKMLKFKFLAKIKKVEQGLFKFWSIFIHIFWGFHQKLGGEGGTLIFLKLEKNQFLVDSDMKKFPISKILFLVNQH